MKIKAIAPWFGGKRTLAPVIVGELGRHTAYWEPFCASMAVLMAKPPSTQETVCDLHGHLINLARVLADPEAAARLYDRAARTLCCDGLYYDSRAWLDEHGDETGEETAYHFLVIAWQGRNGSTGCSRTTYAPSLRFTLGGGSGATRWRSAIESIPWWHERLRNVTIIQANAFDVIPRIADHEDVAVYADPPYVRNTRGNGGGSVYLHDFRDEDHDRLAEQLGRFRRARVVVSYYDCDRVRELYTGWTFREIPTHKNLSNQNCRGGGRCIVPEVLIINGPSHAESRLF